MSQVEVLNASYMPLSPTTLARAVHMISEGEAVVEKSDPTQLIRSQKFEIEKPVSIRLIAFRKIPVVYAEAYWTREGVLERDNYTCAYCGDYFVDRLKINVDHIIPQSQGGPNTWLNTICACVPCNSKKRDRTPEEASMPLLYDPTVVMRNYYNSNKKHKKKKK